MASWYPKSMLAQSISMLYSTHVLLESMNLGVVLMVSTMALHALAVSCRALYGSNLYLELVWLLAPTVVVVLLIVRTIAMQCSDEELASRGNGSMSLLHSWSAGSQWLSRAWLVYSR